MAMAVPILAELAGPTIAPILEDLLGKEAFEKLSPIGQKALTKVLESKAAKKVAHKLGNKFFGKKTHARSLLKKGRSIAGVAFGKNAHKLIGTGLDLGQSFGLLDKNQAEAIKSGYEKASSFHDKLSQFNKKKKPLSTAEGEHSAHAQPHSVPPGM